MSTKTNFKCEVILKKGKCNKEAKFLVRHKDHSEDKSFNVCEDCIDCYKYVQCREHGNTESSFIVKELSQLEASTQ